MEFFAAILSQSNVEMSKVQIKFAGALEMMGHIDIRTTITHYAHLSKANRVELDKFFKLLNMGE